jgi:hypothetical protein
MTDARTERGALEDFVRGTDVWTKWDAARRLMAAKQMQAAANKRWHSGQSMMRQKPSVDRGLEFIRLLSRSQFG